MIPLYTMKGTIINYPVAQDIGLAATSGRYEDIGRFKVPQLRDLAKNGPYFHNNSALTIAEVVDYKNSAQYNQSADGKRHPIKLSAKQRANLIEFLKIL